MKMWTRLGIGLAAIALAIAAGTGAYAMRGDGDGSPKDATRDTDTQQERASNDTAGTMAMCVAEVPDCNDLVVLPEGDQARCAEGAETCVDTPCVGGPAVDCMAPEASGVCYTLDTEPITTECVDTGCATTLPLPIEPAGDDTLPVPPDAGVESSPAGEPGAIGTGCLGEDPCAISSEMKCLPPDCAASSDGTITCSEPVPCDVPPVEIAPVDGTLAEEATEGPSIVVPPAEPCVIDPCFGNDPYAGIPANCPPLCEPPVDPDGVTERAMPCSAPCEQPDPESLVHPCTPIDPCVVPDPSAVEPGETQACPGSDDGGATGAGSAPGEAGADPAQ